MPRKPRIVIPDVPYHVTQRGNNRQDVFFVDDDRHLYLRWLKEYAVRYGLEVRGFCLMTNHIHLIAVPGREDSLARAVGLANSRYAQYVNRFHGRTGHLWQNRFYSCALDERHEVAAMRYVEQNPVRQGLAPAAWDFAWSSASAHLAGPDRWGLLDLRAWKQQWPENEWREMLTAGIEPPQIKNLRRHTARGWPLGSDKFVSKIEHAIGRRLRPLPIGRQKGWRKAK